MRGSNPHARPRSRAARPHGVAVCAACQEDPRQKRQDELNERALCALDVARLKRA